ncbi:hypothetical protein NLJ89_g8622 [Agrocybe chaxingu]|uniref:Uncharacterized protein n=1 Tax=Agrocybe chaxingu TaxID=84603 RepID=A0A9W8JUI7_9AGAR|nr:hypothetical protein NLJ89_g8622 [Agrocybe chaxingu]
MWSMEMPLDAKVGSTAISPSGERMASCNLLNGIDWFTTSHRSYTMTTHFLVDQREKTPICGIAFIDEDTVVIGHALGQLYFGTIGIPYIHSKLGCGQTQLRTVCVGFTNGRTVIGGINFPASPLVKTCRIGISVVSEARSVVGMSPMRGLETQVHSMDSVHSSVMELKYWRDLGWKNPRSYIWWAIAAFIGYSSVSRFSGPGTPTPSPEVTSTVFITDTATITQVSTATQTDTQTTTSILTLMACKKGQAIPTVTTTQTETRNLTETLTMGYTTNLVNRSGDKCLCTLTGTITVDLHEPTSIGVKPPAADDDDDDSEDIEYITMGDDKNLN